MKIICALASIIRSFSFCRSFFNLLFYAISFCFVRGMTLHTKARPRLPFSDEWACKSFLVNVKTMKWEGRRGKKQKDRLRWKKFLCLHRSTFVINFPLNQRFHFETYNHSYRIFRILVLFECLFFTYVVIESYLKMH